MRDAQLIATALAAQEEHAVIVLDPEGRVVEWLPAAVRILGYERDEMIGETLHRLFTPDDLARGDLDWELRAARAYGKSEDDRWHVRKDGVQIWASGSMTALRDANGELTGFFKMLRERTDIRTLVDALQNRIDQAARQQYEKHVLLGTLAHELRNPLGPLRSAAQLIQIAASDRPAIASYVRIIERQIRFIDDLLADLLESTRVGVGKVELHYSRFELRTVIDAAIETCSALLRDRRQRVEVLVPDSLQLEADAVRLQQVLVNVLTNSSKFSPRETAIFVKATVDSDELVLKVEDHGRGIPSELLPKIFDLFTQAENLSSKPGAGLGLGLGLVKSIVELHGGAVQARSEGEDRGTEITVRMPLVRRPAPQVSAHPPPPG